jgi:predicted enzyme related to lactoylglutathione lyase
MADETKPRPDYSIDYIELHEGSIAKAKKFYGDAFGWSFRD